MRHRLLCLQLQRCRNRVTRAPIREFALATVGVVISTAVVGGGFYLLMADMPVSLLVALLFGALISPTDPIAVLSVVVVFSLLVQATTLGRFIGYLGKKEGRAQGKPAADVVFEG